MPSFTTSTTIRRPVEDVFAVISNPGLDHRWSPAVIEAKVTSSGPVGVGTTAHYVSRIFGRRNEYDWQITEFEPNRTIGARSHGGPVAEVGATMNFEPVDGATRFTVNYETDLPGLYRLMWPFMAWYGRRLWDQALRKLKDLMEANAL